MKQYKIFNSKQTHRQQVFLGHSSLSRVKGVHLASLCREDAEQRLTDSIFFFGQRAMAFGRMKKILRGLLLSLS